MPVDTPISLVVIDDHDVVRTGIQAYLEQMAPDISVVASVASLQGWHEVDATADVVILDLLLRGTTSLEAIPALIASGSRVLVYTTEERPLPLRRAVELGAQGVLLKSDPMHSVLNAIRMAVSGEFCVSGPLAHALVTDESLVVQLSEQQRQVLQCLDEGLDYRATGRVMGISEGTVKTYLARIREKFRSSGLEPGNSHHLTRQAFEQGHLR